MFRPSQSFLRRFPTSRAPLDARESRQLLDSLTASFCRHLDNEHPGFYHDTSVETSAIPKHDQNGGRQFIVVSQEHTGTTTNRHIQSILTNSLLNHSPRTNHPGDPRDPMEVFEQAVALGRMTMKGAETCLKAKRLQMMPSSAPSHLSYPSTKNVPAQNNVRNGMRDSGAGRQVLKWLIASGTFKEAAVWGNGSFTHTLVAYLVAEGLQEVVEIWLKDCYERIPLHSQTSDDRKSRTAFGRLLRQLTEAEAFGCGNLDHASRCLSRAAEYASKPNLRSVPQFLSKLIVIRSHGQLQMSSTAFDSFLEIYKSSKLRADCYLPYLHMLHPSRPTSEPALAFLKEKAISLKDAQTTQEEKTTLMLGLKTASFLQERHEFDDAKWVVDFLRTKFAKELGIEYEGRPGLVKTTQAASLVLLEDLSLV